ncbi:hypothetical protein HZA87_01065 [Candidatus Uhrbacteria bacterium]|nr:hypothetical protein [Candidatus Uhrbacteria bacterium]
MLKFIKPTTWEHVFQDWKQREGNDPGWIHCATVLKGWESWESWRRFIAEQIGAPTREWNLFEFTDPMSEIPNMLVGPFSGWQSKLPAPNRHTFADLVRIPEQAIPLYAHEKVTGIMKDFPPSTVFIGLRFEGTPLRLSGFEGQADRIVCIEGHHRATAVALSQLEGIEIDFGGPVTIAVATLATDEISLLDRVLTRGSSKDVKDAGRSALPYIAHPESL